MRHLIESLEEQGIAERTLIVLSADHYPYGLELDEINELAGHKVETTFELYKNHLVLWSASMKETISVTKYCSSLDIMPTIANLMCIEYDSCLYMGSDLRSATQGLVISTDGSFMQSYCSYDA